MPYEPLMDGKQATNLFTEHVFKIRATFGAASALTFRSKDASIAKTTTTTFTITLPKNYAEVTDFSVGQQTPSGAVPLQYIITTNNVTTGTIVITSVETAVGGTATAPAAGDVIYITLGVSADTLNGKFTG